MTGTPPIVVHDQGGVGFVITAIYAYLAVHDDGDEGIIGIVGADGRWLPLIAADQTRLDQLAPQAQQVATVTGKPVRLVQFTARQDLEVIDP